MQPRAKDLTIFPLTQNQNDYGVNQPGWPLAENQASSTPTTTLVEAHNRKAAIESIGILTIYAKTLTASIRQHGLETYDSAVFNMLSHRDKQRDPEHQALVEEYLSHELFSLRRDLSALEMVGIASIAQQIQQSHSSSQE